MVKQQRLVGLVMAQEQYVGTIQQPFLTILEDSTDQEGFHHGDSVWELRRNRRDYRSPV